MKDGTCFVTLACFLGQAGEAIQCVQDSLGRGGRVPRGTFARLLVDSGSLAWGGLSCQLGETSTQTREGELLTRTEKEFENGPRECG